VGTGGTIASRYDPAQGRTVASQEVERIVALLPGTRGLPDLEFDNFATVPSFNMTAEFAHQLMQHVAAVLWRGDVDGVVVTQGTDTLEETSFLADLLTMASPSFSRALNSRMTTRNPIGRATCLTPLGPRPPTRRRGSGCSPASTANSMRPAM
jgi:hypothetical protein